MDRSRGRVLCYGIWLICLVVAVCASRHAAAQQLTLHIKDYAVMPVTGLTGSKSTNASYFSRVNFLREEPGVNRRRLFVNDLNGPLYILDKKSKTFTTYLNLNGRNGQPGLFRKLTTQRGYANGFVNFIFDPDYAHNGKFYTIHIEDPKLPAPSLPDNTNFRGLNVDGYTVTPAIETPGPTLREAVVIEWTDTNPANATFEGTARELMRVQLNAEMHPMGDFIFNPTAKPGTPDWRVLYIACGDSGSGESMNAAIRQNPQRLDTVVGKILRIIPDLNEHQDASTVSENGRYRIPNDNPFVSLPGAHKEIWAYGLRNPNRLSWYFDPADPSKNTLFATVVGLHTWETIDIIHKGANYGYSLREGNEQLKANNDTGKLPDVDKIPMLVGAQTVGMVTPTYPVVQYGHVKSGGDAITSGYVYRGKISSLRGKYIFGDITTGHIWYVDYDEMLAADDGNPATMAKMHEVQIVWDKPGGGNEQYSAMAPITEAAYHARGGKEEGLPGRAVISGGRSDIRFCMDREGELYILSKSDGMIRAVVGAASH
jgi:Glucose / Sorbosone dehydrogenase